MDCIFCKIINGEIPASVVYEDDFVYAFRDINPQAPVHVLIAPKRHMANVLQIDGETAQHVARAIGEVARREHIDQSGFRAVTNCGKDGAQSVDHLHIHLLGGKALSDSMA
ncbi:MAG: histidine triad nucleotide-binding protein [Christensenellales bacterium]|jgi:histidine triad (HIT) family protein